jgi:hypothetical protein
MRNIPRYLILTIDTFTLKCNNSNPVYTLISFPLSYKDYASFAQESFQSGDWKRGISISFIEIKSKKNHEKVFINFRFSNSCILCI